MKCEMGNVGCEMRNVKKCKSAARQVGSRQLGKFAIVSQHVLYVFVLCIYVTLHCLHKRYIIHITLQYYLIIN